MFLVSIFSSINSSMILTDSNSISIFLISSVVFVILYSDYENCYDDKLNNDSDEDN